MLELGQVANDTFESTEMVFMGANAKARKRYNISDDVKVTILDSALE